MTLSRRAFLGLLPKAAAVLAGVTALVKLVAARAAPASWYLTDTDAWFVGPRSLGADLLNARAAAGTKAFYTAFSERGKSPADPLPTLGDALNRCEDGDTVYVLPGHSEAVDLDGEPVELLILDGDKDMRVIGLGDSANRPTLTFQDHAPPAEEA